MKAEEVVRLISNWFVTRQVEKHLVAVEGLDNIPGSGSFVLAPNHRSYFDHFVMEILVQAVTGRPVWFLTKRESFVHTIPRLWSTAWYGIPVDRDTTSPDTLRAVRTVLTSGDVLVVYPEGTRNTETELLPFQAGAFRFALSGDVPILPVAMTGTADVLRKGDRWFRRGGQVTVAFGKPLERNPGIGKQAAAEKMSRETRSAIETLLADLPDKSPTARAHRAAAAGRELDKRITDALDGDGTLNRTDAKRFKRLAVFLRPMEPVRHHIAVQQARLLGLSALNLPVPARLVSAMGVKRTVSRVLDHDPGHKDANYLLGRWHLVAPSFLGGSPAEAVDAFARSVAASEEGDTRGLVGLADAHLASGDRASAITALQRAATAPTEPGSRADLRKERLRLRIITVGASPLPAPDASEKEPAQ